MCVSHILCHRTKTNKDRSGRVCAVKSTTRSNSLTDLVSLDFVTPVVPFSSCFEIEHFPSMV